MKPITVINMQIHLRAITFLGLLCTVIVHSRGKILRFGYKFFARFTLIDGNSRLTSDNAISVVEKVTLLICQYECMKEKSCKTINYNEHEGKCELLDVTKFDHPNAFKRDLKWKHYETDDDVNNIGELCEKLSPCEEHEVCEDTNRQPPYICRCRDGFEGEKCDVYKGPGYDRTIPAASCRVLFEKFKLIPDGLYWIRSLNRQVYCSRRVDGGFSPWSDYGPCSATCGEGVQVRRRTCTKPVPKGGGRSCKRFGDNAQTTKCLVKCNCQTALKYGKSTINLEIGNLHETVECGRFNNHSVTYFTHDAETFYHFHHSSPVISQNITYTNTIEFVTQAVEMFGNCTQSFYVESMLQHRPSCYFENTKKEILDANNADCINCKALFNNKKEGEIRRGFGYITNKTYLPVVSMTFKDTDNIDEYVMIKLDKLMCW